MNQEIEYISDEALEKLSELLLDRNFKETYDKEVDEGVLVISELDGFFSAIVSGPVIISPSQWLPAIWGDYEPDWKNAKAAEDTISLLISIMNSIASTLMEAPEEFEPLFYETQDEDKTVITVEEWCVGYMRGVNLVASEWALGGDDVEALLTTIKAFGDGDSSVNFKDITDEQIEGIPSNMRDIHAYWFDLRNDSELKMSSNKHEPFVDKSSRVGRNDPCPCGSGKKYKKCCLH